MKEDIHLREGESPNLFGPHDRHLRVTRETFGVNVYARGSKLYVEGDPENVRPAVQSFYEMLSRLRSRGSLSEDEVFDIIREVRGATGGENGGPTSGGADQGFAAIDPKFRVTPRSSGQQEYIDAIRNNDMVFVAGPAGTGKTYLAVAMAITALRKGLFRKMVLARPAVEAGEKLGFLPGDFQAKVSPYLRPLYDALHDLLDLGQVKRYMDRDVIEVIPLAFMRGRTLDRAFVILDEAQNTTRSQMKMVLTRLGQGSKLVITGDDTQIDLPDDTPSGLIHAGQVLHGIEGIEFVRLGRADIVRHRLVQDIVDAYADDETKNGRV